MTDHAKRIWLHAIAIVAKARNKCAPGERFEALNLVMGDLEDARRRDQLIMPDFPAVCPDCGQHCETHNGESDCAALQSGEAQAAPEPIIMVDGDKVFGPGKAPDSYVRYMIDDSRFPAWHGCMTHYDLAATPPAQVTVADTIAALKAMPTRTEALGGQDFKYIQLGEALDTLRALAGDGEISRLKESRAKADAVARLVEAARAEADKAMRKYPQPNYVISKVAEEAGEVVKAAIHCAEGRETPEAVIGEIKQAMAMLIRLYIEGDQVHGLPPLAAMEASDDRT